MTADTPNRTSRASVPYTSTVLTPKRRHQARSSGVEIKFTRETATRTVVTKEVVTTDSVHLKVH